MFVSIDIRIMNYLKSKHRLGNIIDLLPAKMFAPISIGPAIFARDPTKKSVMNFDIERLDLFVSTILKRSFSYTYCYQFIQILGVSRVAK